MPMAEPSFEPKMPLRSGLAWMIDLVMSADLAWSPPPYWASSRVTFGQFALMPAMKPSRRSMPLLEVWSWTTMATLPALPMSAHICLAASPAAAMLSVAAVVTGMLESTPESNAMSGIFMDWIWANGAAAALLSRAANAIASGFLAMALVSIVIWFSTSVSVAGPSNVTFAPTLAASSSAPFLTACQNWCWKPLEMMAMYFWPPADPDDPGVAVELEHAAVSDNAVAATRTSALVVN